MEWVLILTMHVMGPYESIRDVQVQMIDGFKTDKSCETAGSKLAMSLISQFGKHANQQKVKRSGSENTPSVFIECEPIAK